MELDKSIIDRINDLKILRHSLHNFNFKDCEDALALIQQKLDTFTAEKALVLFQENLNSNPEMGILHFFLAVTRLHFYPGDHLLADSSLKQFFHDLNLHQKGNLTFPISELLEKHYSSPYLQEHIVNSLKQKLSQTNNHSEKESIRKKLIPALLKIHHNKVDDNANTETLADTLTQSSHPEDWSKAFFYYSFIFEELVKLNNIREILRLWTKVLHNKTILEILESQENFDSLMHILKHITTVSDENIKMQIFLEVTALKKYKLIKNMTRVFKTALATDIFLHDTFFQIIKEWDNLYQSHPSYPLFFKLSGIKKRLTQINSGEKINCQKILKEIEDFEKLIAFDIDTLVEHRNFGIGVIREINLSNKQADESNVFLIINFKSKSKHSMSLRIALNSLELAYSFHLEGIKLFFPEKLKKILESNPIILLQHILLTHKEPVNSKQIKNFMVPEIMREDEWKNKWKMIKSEIPHHNRVIVKNGYYTYNKEMDPSKIKDESFNQTYPKIKGLKEKLIYLEESLQQNYKENLNSIKSAVGTLLTDFEQLPSSTNTENIQELEKYFPALLAIARRLDLPISSQVWEKGKAILKNNLNDTQTENQLSLSLRLLQYANTRTDFIKNLENLYSPEDLALGGVVLLKNISGNIKELILDYWIMIYGDKGIKDIFNIIDKEYLTSLGTFTILAKNHFDKKRNHYPGSLLQLFTKLIKVMHQCHQNIEMDKNRISSKKNFNTLYRILFEEGNLFKYLHNDTTISNEDRITILKSLEQKTYLDNNVKRDVRTLHSSLTKQ